MRKEQSIIGPLRRMFAGRTIFVDGARMRMHINGTIDNYSDIAASCSTYYFCATLLLR